jgi:hypothetical protein
MNKPKQDKTQAAVVTKSPVVEPKPLSKPEQAAVDAAKLKPKNDGSHIATERKKRLEEAQRNQEQK